MAAAVIVRDLQILIHISNLNADIEFSNRRRDRRSCGHVRHKKAPRSTPCVKWWLRTSQWGYTAVAEDAKTEILDSRWRSQSGLFWPSAFLVITAHG